MPTARDVFLRHSDPEGSAAGADAHVTQLRANLTQSKLNTLQRVRELDADQLATAMPQLYQEIVATTIQLAARVGLATGLALEAFDEHTSGVSISSFSREVREQLTETGVNMKRRHSSRIAKLVSEVEAQRLAWRHNHEFLSWLGFRRDDGRYPAADRRDRLDAFKVQPRLLQSRESVAELLGRELAIALEGHDRFMLANRWRLAPSPDHGVEFFIWPLLSYQDRNTVLLETARFEFDAMVEANAGEPEVAAKHQELRHHFREQLAQALDHVPEGLAHSVI